MNAPPTGYYRWCLVNFIIGAGRDNGPYGWPDEFVNVHYLYFRDKDDLLFTVVDEGLRQQ